MVYWIQLLVDFRVVFIQIYLYYLFYLISEIYILFLLCTFSSMHLNVYNEGAKYGSKIIKEIAICFLINLKLYKKVFFSVKEKVKKKKKCFCFFFLHYLSFILTFEIMWKISGSLKISKSILKHRNACMK